MSKNRNRGKKRIELKSHAIIEGMRMRRRKIVEGSPKISNILRS